MKVPKPTTSPAEKIELAIRYVNNGIPAVPGHRKKDGKCSCGDERCRTPGRHARVDKPATNHVCVQEYWGEWPKARVGLMGGVNNIIAVKLKTDGAGRPDEPWSRRPRAWVEWEKTQGLPRTVMFRSKNMDVLLFRLPKDDVPAGILKIADGITVFGAGEFVELPQSFRSKDKLAFYQTYKPGQVDIAPVPVWFYRMINYTLLRDGGKSGFETTLIPYDMIEQPEVPLDQERVKLIAESLQVTDIRTPLYVRQTKSYQFALLSDRHEFEAVKLQYPEHAPCAILTLDDTDAELWKLAQLLNQPKLPVLDWAEAVMRWVELVKLKAAQGAHPRGGPQPHDRGFSRAGRVIGVPRRDVERASKIASICAAAKAEIRRLNLNVKRDLLVIGAEPEELQLAKLHELTRDRKSESADETGTPDGSAPGDAGEQHQDADQNPGASPADERHQAPAAAEVASTTITLRGSEDTAGQQHKANQEPSDTPREENGHREGTPDPDATQHFEAAPPPPEEKGHEQGVPNTRIDSPPTAPDLAGTDDNRAEVSEDFKALDLAWERHCAPLYDKLSDDPRRHFIRLRMGYLVVAPDRVAEPGTKGAEGDA